MTEALTKFDYSLSVTPAEWGDTYQGDSPSSLNKKAVVELFSHTVLVV
jgi:hypothetical protein